MKKKLPSLTICNDSIKKTIAFKTESKLQTLARENSEQYNKTSDNFVRDCAMKTRQDILNTEPILSEEPRPNSRSCKNILNNVIFGRK